MTTRTASTASLADHVASQAGVAALALSLSTASLATSIANVGLAELADAFGAGFGAVRWVVLAYLLVVASVIAVAGRAGDAFGRRRLLIGGLAVFAAASTAAGLAPTISSLVAARAAQGLGAACMMAMALAMVGSAVPAGRTGQAVGWLGTASALGTTLGPSLGGLLIAAFGWRALFFAPVPPSLLAAWLAARHLPADGPGERQGTSTRAAFAALHERRIGARLLPGTLAAAVVMATLVAGPFYLSRVLRLEPVLLGVVAGIGPLVAALAGAPAGRAVDRLGAGPLAGAGLAAMAIGSAALAAPPGGPRLAGYVLSVAVLTGGYALFQASNNTSVLAAAGTTHRGLASGLLHLSRHLGLLLGAAAIGAVFARAGQGHEADAAGVALGFRQVFCAAAVLCTAALAIARPAPAHLKLPAPHGT